MNDPWIIQLFNGLRVRHAGRVISRFRTQKTGALLAYLAYHHQRSHPREVLIEIFWPDTSPESGRHNLSHALSSLRHQLEPPGVPAGAVVVADRFAVELGPAAFTTDVADFESALRTAAQARNSPDQMPLLAEALEKYGGALLPDDYELWIEPERERLAQRFQQAAAQLIGLREKSGDREGALEIARRAVALDPLREEANRELLRLLAAAGQFEAAWRHYREFERVLEREGGEEPGSALRQMAQFIQGQLTQSHTPVEMAAMAAAIAPPLPADTAQGRRRALPTGTVTFLLTDIEGSTAQWEKAGDAFRSALATHHSLLRREFRRNNGQEVKEAGDSFLVVFSSVGDAIACAISAQRALKTEPWPEEMGGGPRVRMALHTGDVELDEGEYHGLILHRAARILSAAHGGQIICSEASAGLLKRDLDWPVRLKDLGVWRLRDVEEPERLFQAVYPEMEPSEFPPLRASAAHRAHLPLQFTRFFGREAEIARIGEMLASPETRLLTLTGPGGTGKTRLCIEAAGRFSETFAGAIWFVPRADLSDTALIPQTILHALGLPLTGGQESGESLLITALANPPTLLLLDNFEHLLGAGGAEVVQTLLSRVPGLQCLITSRQTLNLPGETEFAVAPLPTPNGSSTPERLSLFESVRLFVDRAQAAKPDFRITSSNAPAVAELCDQLEGIPLAIELAAARALVLTPSRMLAQLGNRFEFLISHKRGIAERQRTLRAAVDWSYRLLAPDIQRFFAQLCVFRGGWTAEAAEAVCKEPLALDLLAELRECSMVTIQDSEVGVRFGMLESLREYAEARLSEGAERAHVERRHAEYFLIMAEEAAKHLENQNQKAWLDRLEGDHDNLRAALRWCQTEAEYDEIGLRLAGALWKFWKLHGYLTEGRKWLEDTLARSGSAPVALRARASAGAGNLAWIQGDSATARVLQEDSLRLFREIGDEPGVAFSLSSLGEMAFYTADHASARALYEESLAMYRRSGEQSGSAYALNNLGNVADHTGEYEAARSQYAQSLEIFKALGDKIGSAYTLCGLGNVAYHQEDYERASCLYQESLALQRELNDRSGIAMSLENLAGIAYYQADYDTARSLYVESLTIRKEIGDKWGIASSLKELAAVVGANGRAEQVALFCGAAEVLRETIGAPLVPHADHTRIVAGARAALGEEAFAAAWSEGRAMRLEQVIQCAMEESGK